MIIPILNGLLRWRQAPITWLLFLLNAVVYVGGMIPSENSQTVINQYLDDPSFLRLQGRLFSQFVKQNETSYSPLVLQLAEKAENGDPEKLRTMGTLAIRSSEFMNRGPASQYRGDQVEIKLWREKLANLRASQDRHPSYVLGLTADAEDLSHWLSYIFVHSGGYHFVGNMFFLLIFGSMLEPIIGGLALMVVFLLSGMVGAGVFLLLSGATAAPLIGASGSISGLMALFCFLFWKRPVRFIYILLPSVHYTGLIFLPAWVVLVMFALSDLAGYWSAVNEFGGVAYTAHLGGEFAALLIGMIIYLLRYRRVGLNVPESPDIPVGTPISIHELVINLKHSS